MQFGRVLNFHSNIRQRDLIIMKNVSYAKRGYQYVKNYGVVRLHRKVQERLYRNSLEKGYQDWMVRCRPAGSEKELQRSHHFDQNPCISIAVPV